MLLRGRAATTLSAAHQRIWALTSWYSQYLLCHPSQSENSLYSQLRLALEADGGRLTSGVLVEMSNGSASPCTRCDVTGCDARFHRGRVEHPEYPTPSLHVRSAPPTSGSTQRSNRCSMRTRGRHETADKRTGDAHSGARCRRRPRRRSRARPPLRRQPPSPCSRRRWSARPRAPTRPRRAGLTRPAHVARKRGVLCAVRREPVPGQHAARHGAHVSRKVHTRHPSLACDADAA